MATSLSNFRIQDMSRLLASLRIDNVAHVPLSLASFTALLTILAIRFLLSLAVMGVVNIRILPAEANLPTSESFDEAMSKCSPAYTSVSRNTSRVHNAVGMSQYKTAELPYVNRHRSSVFTHKESSQPDEAPISLSPAVALLPAMDTGQGVNCL